MKLIPALAVDSPNGACYTMTVARHQTTEAVNVIDKETQYQLDKTVRELEHPVEHRRKTAQETIDRLGKWFDTDATVTNGVVRWNSNGHVPPTDVLGVWVHLGKSFDLEKSLAAQQADIKASLEAYRRNYKGPSAEQRAEARAAHGPGVRLMDVITGHTWTT